MRNFFRKRRNPQFGEAGSGENVRPDLDPRGHPQPALGIFFTQATAGADPLIPDWIMTSQQASLMRFIFLGLGLMLLMIFRPQGIFGDRRELAIEAR